MKTYNVYTKTGAVLEVKAEDKMYSREKVYFLNTTLEEYEKSEYRDRHMKAIFNFSEITGFQEVTNG